MESDRASIVFRNQFELVRTTATHVQNDAGLYWINHNQSGVKGYGPFTGRRLRERQEGFGFHNENAPYKAAFSMSEVELHNTSADYSDAVTQPKSVNREVNFERALRASAAALWDGLAIGRKAIAK